MIMKESYISWEAINPIIRERFFIEDKKISDIGYVTIGGNLLVSYKAIIEVFNNIYWDDYGEKQIEKLVNWIKKLMGDTIYVDKKIVYYINSL